MKYKVKLSDKAYFSIIDIIKFLARVNVIAARKEKVLIFNCINSLCEFPLRHESVPGLKINGRETYKFAIDSGKYVVLYTIIENVVFIYDVLDSRKENKIIKDIL